MTRSLQTLLMIFLALSLVLFSACEDNDDGGGSAGNDATSSENNTSSNTSSNNTSSNNVSSNNTSSCDQTDPKDQSCSDAENCKVECDCGGGLSTTIASCTFGVCANSPTDCSSSCSDSGGTFTDNYCFVGTTGSSNNTTTNNTTTNNNNCGAFGDNCTFSSDCCSGSCDFDDLCE